MWFRPDLANARENELRRPIPRSCEGVGRRSSYSVLCGQCVGVLTGGTARLERLRSLLSRPYRFFPFAGGSGSGGNSQGAFPVARSVSRA
ncbi:MAG: hypothetical protein [Circular genetic element sp.]|nr:MAG: hypothetical protein [Circular genetic element sp.]